MGRVSEFYIDGQGRSLLSREAYNAQPTPRFPKLEQYKAEHNLIAIKSKKEYPEPYILDDDSDWLYQVWLDEQNAGLTFKNNYSEKKELFFME